MLQVKHLLAGKKAAIYSINPDEPVLSALQMMADHHVGALLVMRDNALVGIVSERDYARKVILRGRSSAETPVWVIMSAPVISASPDDTLQHCMRLCTEHHIRHLPVTEGANVVGVLSIGDLVKAVIDQQTEQLEHLQRYIAG